MPMTRWLNTLQPWGVVMLRLVAGFAMIYNGWEKVYPKGGFNGHNFFAPEQYFCQFVAHLGLPYWLGYVSAVTEVFGGFCLMIGLFTRFWALMIAGNMVVAIVTVNRHHGYTGSQYSLALVAMSLMLLLTGPGRWAIDRRLGLH